MATTAPQTNGAEVIEGEVVALERRMLPAPATLFRTDDPIEVLSRAAAAANALAAVIEQRHLYASIQGRKHITVEGWQTLGAMLGVTPVCTWSRRVTEPAQGWEARVEARTLDGRTIGAAEAECLRSETRWASVDDYAVRSMSQTRATSKALASVLRFVVTLAGFEGTPADEMPAAAPADPTPRGPAPQPIARAPEQTEPRLTANQREKLLIPRAEKAGLSAAEFANVILAAGGAPPRTWDTEEHARQTLDRLLDQMPRRLKDAVLAGIAAAGKGGAS